jgi:hypothetical protein
MKRYPLQHLSFTKVNRELDLEPPPLKKAKKEKRLSWMKNILSRKKKKASRKSSRKKLSQDNLRRVIVNKNLKGKDGVDCVESSEYVVAV